MSRSKGGLESVNAESKLISVAEINVRSALIRFESPFLVSVRIFTPPPPVNPCSWLSAKNRGSKGVDCNDVKDKDFSWVKQRTKKNHEAQVQSNNFRICTHGH